jgi:sterol desaturase/sphingolipid hydroxylase (fatty acid hydroxylase superfamily)
LDEKYVAAAIPLFFLLIGVEMLALRLRGGPGRYRFADSIANLSCGVGQQVVEPFLKSAALVPYAWLWTHARLFDPSPRSPWVWVLLVLAMDLCFYVYHRASHRIGFLWAIHAVHHQSEEYNLSVALRQPWLGMLAGITFYMPLAVLGFSPAMFLGAITIDTLYQFWIHTRAIGRLGPLEAMMNTPSHHRVHHGIDPEYVDRNYGGIFIVWDRLFGTFRREEREPVYGTVKAVRTWNAVRVNAAGWIDLAARCRASRSWLDKVKVWFAPPEWRPSELGGTVAVPKPDPSAHPRYDVRLPRRAQVYVGAQFAIAAIATMAYLWSEARASRASLALAAVGFVVTLFAWGGVLDRQRWGWPLEISRLATVAGLAVWMLA